MKRTRRYRTQRHLPLGMAAIGLVAAVIVAVAIIHDGAPATEALSIVVMCTAFTGVLGFAICWQRVAIDQEAGALRFAGVSTWHRWRSLPLAEIDEVVYDDFRRSRRALISGLVIHMKRVDGRRPRHRLIDHSFGSFGGPSDLFREIAATVRAAQPRADIDPALLPRPGQPC